MSGEYYAGIDIGSRMTKVVIMDDDLLATHIVFTSPEQRKLANVVMNEALNKAGISFADLSFVVATGYGRINVPFADKQVTEITCHARGTGYFLPTVRTIIDVGGQDSKGIKLENGRPVDFVMNDKCAAGTGRFIEIMAEGLGVKLEEVGELSLKAEKKSSISSTCTVFAEQEAVDALSHGIPVEEILAGLMDAIATRVFRMVNRLKIEKDVAFTGGGARNIGLVKALEDKFGFPVLVPQEPLITGAVGAALMGKDSVEKAHTQGKQPVRSSNPLQEVSFFE
ncbi:MAG: 2-hydroxyglutaryl-CoA dehydratase [Dehalococcoidales bacterium]|nr:2-hydroxyglutaryl-CoA dehydratase [Dehalococcoidales bacterium]